jgi:hypothetical protein
MQVQYLGRAGSHSIHASPHHGRALTLAVDEPEMANKSGLPSCRILD